MAQRQQNQTIESDVAAEESQRRNERLDAEPARGEREARREGVWGGEGLRDTTRAVRQAAQRENILPDLGTAALVGGAVALVESKMLPGVLIGAGALLARRLLPVAGLVLKPVLKTAVQAGYGVYASAQSAVAEAREQFDDMVAEARTERERQAPRSETPA